MPSRTRSPSCQSLTSRLKLLLSGTPRSSGSTASRTEASDFALGASLTCCSQADLCEACEASRTEDDFPGLSEAYSGLGRSAVGPRGEERRRKTTSTATATATATETGKNNSHCRMARQERRPNEAATSRSRSTSTSASASTSPGVGEAGLRSRLAEYERRRAELTHRLRETSRGNEGLRVTLLGQVERNNQLTAETRECQLQASARQSVQRSLEQAQARLGQLTRLIAHEEGLTFQTEARLLHLRQQHRRVTETCLRLQIATASNTGQTERVDQRVARLESCRETARRCKRLFNRWQDLAGGIRVLVRIYSHPTRQPATNADANANGDADWTPGYTTGCLMVPSPDEVGVLSRTASSGDEAIGEERSNEAHSVRLFHVNEVLHSASPEADQLADLARRVAGHLSGGRSSAVICYGPRGTGKTHTCLYGAGRRLHDGLAGLVVQALLEAHQLHDFGWLIGAGGGATNGSWLAVSLLEVYNERVTCLLSGRDVQMRDDGRRMHVVGQLERPVRHVDNFVEVLRTAIAARRTACLAGQARHASRSHMIMMLRHRSEATSGWTSGWLNGGCVRSESRSGSNQSSRAYSQTVSDSAPSTRRGVDGPGQAIRHGNYEDYENCKEEEEEEEAEGTFILADLAGYTVSGLDAGEAELATSGSGSVGRRGGVKRPNRSFSCRGDSRGAEAKRLWRMEASEINRSLGAFRQVLHCLSSSERQVVAPFRNSRLTQLLKPCFAGDTQTTLVLNLTGDRRHQQATTHCLELGQVAMGLAFGHN